MKYRVDYKNGDRITKTFATFETPEAADNARWKIIQTGCPAWVVEANT